MSDTFAILLDAAGKDPPVAVTRFETRRSKWRPLRDR